MTKEDKAKLTEIYRKYKIRDELIITGINKDREFDNRAKFDVYICRNENLRDVTWAVVSGHPNLFVLKTEKEKLPVYPDDFTLVE